MGILNRITNLFSRDETPAPATPPKPQRDPAEIYGYRIEGERSMKDDALRRDPYSPIPDRTNFTGLVYYEPDLSYRYQLTLHSIEPETFVMPTSTEDEREFERVGFVEFEVEGASAKLFLYQSDGVPGYFLPFRDSTSGNETYGAGRYLEIDEAEQGQLVLDFNLAYNPYCAYSPDFSCPIPPRENWLQVPIRAGERSYKDTEVEH